MIVEQFIAIFFLLQYLFTRDIEIAKACGIFSIASYVGMIYKKLNGSDVK